MILTTQFGNYISITCFGAEDMNPDTTPSFTKVNGLTVNPMEDAPRNGDQVLLYHRHHGWVQAWFSQGEWSDDTPISPREYSGSVWVCGDDAYQVEVEEYPKDCPLGLYGEPEILGWLPIAVLPALVEDK